MYVFTYTDPEGKRHSVYSKDIMALRKKEENYTKDKLDGIDAYVAANATLNFVFDRYISTKSELRLTTKKNYVYMYDRYVRDGFGKKKISSIKYSDVLIFYQFLLDKKGLQVNTLDTIHTVLHPTFELAVRDAVIRTNPCKGVMALIKKIPGKNHGVRHALTPVQHKAFVDYIDNSTVYCNWRPIIRFLLGTGCRVGEAIGITWKDIDFENRTISINHALIYFSGDYKEHRAGTYIISSPKTEAGKRLIPMMDTVYDILKEEYEDQKENGFCEDEIDGVSGFVFMNRFGHVCNPQAINRAIKRIYESYNADEIVNAARDHRTPVILPHFSCHHLRHTFCSRFCEKEPNVKVIQSIMGHANIETTMDVYAEVNDSVKNEAIQKLAHNFDVF